MTETSSRGPDSQCRFLLRRLGPRLVGGSKRVTGSFTFYVDDAYGNRVHKPEIVIVGPFDRPIRAGAAPCNSGTWTIGVKFW